MAIVSLADLEGTAWNLHPPSHITQKIGDDFIKVNQYLVLKVPSVVAFGDFNYLINPEHTEFSRVKIIDINPFGFDQRLFKSILFLLIDLNNLIFFQMLSICFIFF